MSDTALLKRIKALTIFRAFFVTLLLGSFFAFNIGYYKFPYPHAIIYLIVTLYLLTILYALLLNRIQNLTALAYTQLSLDVLSEIFLIFVTGGIGSWFSSIMFLTVMASAIVLNKKAAYLIATLCSILYGFMIDLQFYQIIPLPYDTMVKEKDFLYNIFSHISALYLTAYLTGHLSSGLEKTSRTLKEKVSDLEDLTLFNRELIESLPSGLLTTDPSGRVLVFNKSAENITGTSRSEAIGQHLTYIFPFLSYPIEKERMEGAITCNKTAKVIGLASSEIMDSEGRKTGNICVFQDITQIKNLEAELKHKERLAVMGEFSTNIAHEIRNPLASMKSSIELLKEGTITKEHSERLMDIVISEMDRLNKTITDLLIYTKPRPIRITRFDLHKVLDETVELLKNSIENTDNITITCNIKEGNEIAGDPGKLRQVFLNLGMNAIESMPGGGRLTISTIQHDGTISILFEDTGIGIPKENLEHIFYPFFTTREKGTGLGLPIAYRIIEEHNGKITVNSVPGHGTTFEILLPVTPSFSLYLEREAQRR